MEVCIVFSLVMLNSNCFQNRNSNPKNRLKLETRFLLYPSGMVKRVRISTFDYHSRFGDRRSAHIKRSGNLTCARSDSDSCVARLTDALHSQQLAATVTRARCRKQTGGDWGGSAVGQPTSLIYASYRRSFDVYSCHVCTAYAKSN